MKIELAEDYEEKIFRSVMERRKKAQKIRKRVLCIIIIFTCLFGITSMSYSKFKKENYDNYFISNSENQLIEDEYEYFDGLGLKLNFINYAEDSIIIGFNIKYDDIAGKEIFLEEFTIKTEKGMILYSYGKEEKMDVENKDKEIHKKYIHMENKNQILYMIEIENYKNLDGIELEFEKIRIADKNETKDFEISWKQIIEKEKE